VPGRVALASQFYGSGRPARCPWAIAADPPVTQAAPCEQAEHEDLDADLRARHAPVVARPAPTCTSALTAD
jgi:hypothetical protein